MRDMLDLNIFLHMTVKVVMVLISIIQIECIEFTENVNNNFLYNSDYDNNCLFCFKWATLNNKNIDKRRKLFYRFSQIKQKYNVLVEKIYLMFLNNMYILW